MCWLTNMLFQFLQTFFQRELFFCLKKVNHVTINCKRPIVIRDPKFYKHFNGAAVCIVYLPSKQKFRNSSYSVRKNPLVKHFRKSQSKFPKKFLFRENWQKGKCCLTPYSRRSKTFELYHFQSPREGRRLKETTSSLAGK